MNRVNKLDMDAPIEGPIVTEYAAPRDMRAVAAAVVNQAIRDLTNRSTPLPRQRDAFLWITSGQDFEGWLDWAGVPFLDPYRVLVNLRKARQLLSGKASLGRQP